MTTYTTDQLTQMARHVFYCKEQGDKRADELVLAMCRRLRESPSRVLQFLKIYANAPHPMDDVTAEFANQFREFFKGL